MHKTAPPDRHNSAYVFNMIECSCIVYVRDAAIWHYISNTKVKPHSSTLNIETNKSSAKCQYVYVYKLQH